MSVGLSTPLDLLPIKGVRLAVTSANIYSEKRNDLTLIEINKGSVVCAVFTKNQFCAAPVILAKENLSKSEPRYLLINSGNANAGTGKQGVLNARSTCKILSELALCNEFEILPFSTGVIGEDLPVDKINKVLPNIIKKLSDDNWLDAAKSIMTTDTIPKAISSQLILDGKKVSITGIVKGSGMIKPNMATMLSYIATDANISKSILDKLLFTVIEKSFNRITIDGDTSTNDACVLISTGKANNSTIDNCDNENYIVFEREITKVCCALAQAIVRDGEGATKYITIDINKGKDSKECLDVAYKIAESLLVKTAFTASDPNWGRILAAVGNAGIDNLDVSNVDIYLDDVCIVKNGERSNTYREVDGKLIMSRDEIKLSVELNRGEFAEEIWTTDLSHEYISINSDYRS